MRKLEAADDFNGKCAISTSVIGVRDIRKIHCVYTVSVRNDPE